MKIAAITEDGTTISQHFGRAPLYLVVTVEDAKGRKPLSASLTNTNLSLEISQSNGTVALERGNC